MMMISIIDTSISPKNGYDIGGDDDYISKDIIEYPYQYESKYKYSTMCHTYYYITISALKMDNNNSS